MNDCFPIVIFYACADSKTILHFEPYIFTKEYQEKMLLYICKSPNRIKHIWCNFFERYWGLACIQKIKGEVIKKLISYKYFYDKILFMSIYNDDVELFDRIGEYNKTKLTYSQMCYFFKYMAYNIVFFSKHYFTRSLFYGDKIRIPYYISRGFEAFINLENFASDAPNKSEIVQYIFHMPRELAHTRNVCYRCPSTSSLMIYCDMLSQYKYTEIETECKCTTEHIAPWQFRHLYRNIFKLYAVCKNIWSDPKLHTFLASIGMFTYIWDAACSFEHVQKNIQFIYIETLKTDILSGKPRLQNLFEYQWVFHILYIANRCGIFEYICDRYHRLIASEVKMLITDILDEEHNRQLFEKITAATNGKISPQMLAKLYVLIK